MLRDPRMPQSQGRQVPFRPYRRDVLGREKDKYKLCGNWPSCKQLDCNYVHWPPVERDLVEEAD